MEVVQLRAEYEFERMKSQFEKDLALSEKAGCRGSTSCLQRIHDKLHEINRRWEAFHKVATLRNVAITARYNRSFRNLSTVALFAGLESFGGQDAEDTRLVVESIEFTEIPDAASLMEFLKPVYEKSYRWRERGAIDANAQFSALKDCVRVDAFYRTLRKDLLSRRNHQPRMEMKWVGLVCNGFGVIDMKSGIISLDVFGYQSEFYDDSYPDLESFKFNLRVLLGSLAKKPRSELAHLPAVLFQEVPED